METETRTLAGRVLATSDPDVLLVTSERMGTLGVFLTRDELRAVAQEAYDRHGIAADPFATPGSAEAPEGPRIVEHRVGHVVHRTAEFTNAAHNTGVRA